MIGADVVIGTLKELGVDTIFGYPGGAILPIYDALFRDGSIKHILVRHEQAAVHAAEAYAKVSGKTGVVFATSGPGITNCITGLMDALSDSIPIVVISGQVSSAVLGTDAFQECDATGITRHCTKYNRLIASGSELRSQLFRAFHWARAGRPGPVHIDIPKDLQSQEANEQDALLPLISQTVPSAEMQINPVEIEAFAQLLSQAKKPLLYVGGGLARSGSVACELLQKFCDRLQIPCTMTLMGLGSLPGDHAYNLGMLGMHGSYEANLAAHHCDLLINIGARFDDRVTGRLDQFSPNSKKIHIDVDASNINKVVNVDMPIVSDAAIFLKGLVDALEILQGRTQPWDAWWQDINAWREVDSFRFDRQSNSIKPQDAIRRISDQCKNRRTYVTTDVGQHQMWVAQHFCLSHPRQLVTSGGLGTMGFGFPAGLGCQVFDTEAVTLVFTGDASILMNIQELSTAVQYRLPLKIIILNNSCMGMVHQWQTLFYDSRYSQSYMNSLPDFVALARSFGADGFCAEDSSTLDEGVAKMFSSDKPFILDLRIDSDEAVLPMIAPGAGHHEMILPQ